MKNTGLKLVVGVVFLVVVAGAVFGVLQWVTAKTTLYVAATDIQPHQVIQASDLLPVEVHKTVTDLPASYITDPMEVEGTHARTIILANQLISRDMIAEFTPEEVEVLALEKDERLYMLTISTQGSAGGQSVVPAYMLSRLLQPGDTVSLIAVTQDGRAKTFAQGVLVVGMVVSGGQQYTDEEGQEQAPASSMGVEAVLMLKITPEVAEQISAAMAGGSVLLGIDPYEFEVVETPGASINELVGEQQTGPGSGYGY